MTLQKTKTKKKKKTSDQITKSSSPWSQNHKPTNIPCTLTLSSTRAEMRTSARSRRRPVVTWRCWRASLWFTLSWYCFWISSRCFWIWKTCHTMACIMCLNLSDKTHLCYLFLHLWTKSHHCAVSEYVRLVTVWSVCYASDYVKSAILWFVFCFWICELNYTIVCAMFLNLSVK